MAVDTEVETRVLVETLEETTVETLEEITVETLVEVLVEVMVVVPPPGLRAMYAPAATTTTTSTTARPIVVVLVPVLWRFILARSRPHGQFIGSR